MAYTPTPKGFHHDPAEPGVRDWDQFTLIDDERFCIRLKNYFPGGVPVYDVVEFGPTADDMRWENVRLQTGDLGQAARYAVELAYDAAEGRLLRADALCRAAMAIRPDLPQDMSMDDWMSEYRDILTVRERDVCDAVLHYHVDYNDENPGKRTIPATPIVTPEPPFTCTVCLHGVQKTAPGTWRHADELGAIEAWEVWTRRDYLNGANADEPFDIMPGSEKIFAKDSRERALAYANLQAQRFGAGEVDEY